MAKIMHKELFFDSNEEIEFYEWLLEAKKNGIVEYFEYQPEQIMLSEPAKINGKHLFRKHVYTPDFKVLFSIFGMDAVSLKPLLSTIANNRIAIIDIKGKFARHGSDAKFSINRKWVWEKYGKYIHKIIPEEMFERTWCPEYARYTKVRKEVRKKYIDVKTVEQFIKAQGEK